MTWERNSGRKGPDKERMEGICREQVKEMERNRKVEYRKVGKEKVENIRGRERKKRSLFSRISQ